MSKLFIRSLFILLLPLTVCADSETAMDWLKKVAEAQQNLNYYGTFVYNHDGELESMKVVHAAGEKGERERLVHLNGAPREVIRNNDLVMCIFSEDKTVLVTGRDEYDVSPMLQAESINTYQDNYQIILGEGNGRVAGLQAQVIELRPKDLFRYGHRFWVSPEGLLLRSDLVNQDGELIEQIMFTEVSIVDEVPHQMMKPEINIDDFSWYRQEAVAEPDTSNNQWHLTSMPKGFSIQGHRQQQASDDDEGIVEHMSLSDGLASVSVFIEQKAPETDEELGGYQVGALSIFSKVSNGHHITVVGDVPSKTVKIIADAVSRNK